MSEGLSIYDVTPEAPPPRPKTKSKGISVALLSTAPEPTSKSQAHSWSDSMEPAKQFASRSADAVKTAASFWQNPDGVSEAAVKTLAKGALSMVTLAASGIGALVKSAVTTGERNSEAFSRTQKDLESALTVVNQAPASEQEKAMQGLLNIIPDGISAVGDTVYEKTGSALAGAGSQAMLTLLTLSPEVGGKVLSKVKEAPKGEVSSSVSSAFDELAAKHPEGATALADHVEQVDKNTAKYMKTRIQKFVDASDKELSIVGKNAAEAALKDIEAKLPKNLAELAQKPNKPGKSILAVADNKIYYKDGTVEPVPEEMKQKPWTDADQLGTSRRSAANSVMTPEQVSSSIRTAAKESQEAIQEADYTVGEEPQNMSLSKEERAAQRELIAAKRDQAEGVKRKFEPEPIPRRAAEHEGEVARRNAEEEVEPATNANGALYLNAGIPVTRAQVEAAFRFTNRLVDKVPGVTIAKAKMARLYNSYIETFNPEAKGEPARIAGSAIAQSFFEQARREHKVWQQGKKRREYWQKMGEVSSMEFIDKAEKGIKLDNPEQETARIGYKNWADEIYQQDLKTGFTYDPVDHYMPHLFEDGDGVLRFMQKRYGNKWADPGFIKERGYDLYQEAVEAGFTPKFKNPEEIMQARQHASDIAALRTGLLADLERKGVAVRAAKGADRPPTGFSPNSRRSPTGQRYWVREEADALMHNAFDSKSLWQDTGLKGDAFRGFMELKNKIIPIKLALSLFHPMHVMHIDASATLARQTKSMIGSPSLANIRDFMLKGATSYLQPLWSNPKLGYPLLRVFQGKRDFASLSEADKTAFKDLSEGGMVPTRPMEETSGSIQKFKDAITKRSATAVFHMPFAALASLGHPIYNVWIPSLKIASYLKDAKAARELNPNWTPVDRQVAFRQIARKVEARYGEMNYNSLFMDKTLKDIGVATNLSLGWNIGLLDQYVGGAIDLGKGSKQIGLDLLDPASKGSELKRQVASGQLDRPVFAAYYISSALMIGGLMHYFFTGKKPQSLVDYTHPESGEVDQYGKPVRLNTMFYTREFEGLYKHMEIEGAGPGLADFIKNKGSGMLEMSQAAITGVDSLGQDIRDPEAPAYKQVEQTLWSEFGDLNPISIEAIQKSTGNRVKMGGLSVLGFTPAGKYISETVIEGQIANNYNKYVRPKEKPFQAVEMSKDVKELRQDYLNDDPKYDIKLEGMIAKYQMDDKDIRKLTKMFNSPKEQEFDPSVFMFSKLPWEVQKPLLDKMQPEERETYLGHISKSKRRKYEQSQEQAE